MSEEMYDHDHEEEVVAFATTNFRGGEVKFGIKTDDRRRHVYIVGKTGMGKTTLLENMVLHDIYAGHGVAYIDPHGDTADNLLDFIPEHRMKDVVYFNPSDLDFPIGFNILEVKDEAQRHLVASGLMGVFKKIWEGVWSPRMEYILLNCILAMLEVPNSTMMGIARILADKNYRDEVVAQIKDPVVKSFWVNEFAGYSDRFASEAIAPVQNKVGQFLSAGLIRNIVAQEKSTVDMRAIMDGNKILICNLSKGLIGEDNSKLLGGMIITRLQLAAMERVDMPEEKRPDFYLYVDEFQNFATESFANILSEARKYRLNLITAHQYIEQLDETVAAAIFGNVGTIVSFRVGSQDAETLAKEFAPTFTEEDVINLAKFEIYLKLMIDGVASTPFSARTLPPIAKRLGNHQAVVDYSRKMYAQKKAVVENIVEKWSEEAGEGMRKGKSSGKGGAKFGNRTAGHDDSDRQHVANCSRCNKELRLRFKPDPSRPFYCKECLPEVKKERESAMSAALKRPSPPTPTKVEKRPPSPEGNRRAKTESPAPRPTERPAVSRAETSRPKPAREFASPSISASPPKQISAETPESAHQPKPEPPKPLSALPSLTSAPQKDFPRERPKKKKKNRQRNDRKPPPPKGAGGVFGGRIRVVSNDAPADDEILTVPKKDKKSADASKKDGPVVAFKEPDMKKNEEKIKPRREDASMASGAKGSAAEMKSDGSKPPNLSKKDSDDGGPKPLKPGQSVSF